MTVGISCLNIKDVSGNDSTSDGGNADTLKVFYFYFFVGIIR